jgi:uncharacterized protein (TIGR03085 family)
MPWVDAERQAFADVFRSTDPDAPTLCEGWTTRHVLAHLVQRTQGPPWAAIGDMVGHREPGQEKYMGRLVEAARSDAGYEALVTQFQKGAPRWSPMSWADESLNFIEYVIHIEDVRRGRDTRLSPRVLPPAEVRSIWKRLRLIAKMTYLRAPVGVTLLVPDGGTEVVKKRVDGVALTGDPVELLLYVSGRREAAHVELTGPPKAVAAFQAWVARSGSGFG